MTVPPSSKQEVIDRRGYQDGYTRAIEREIAVLTDRRVQLDVELFNLESALRLHRQTMVDLEVAELAARGKQKKVA